MQRFACIECEQFCSQLWFDHRLHDDCHDANRKHYELAPLKELESLVKQHHRPLKIEFANVPMNHVFLMPTSGTAKIVGVWKRMFLMRCQRTIHARRARTAINQTKTVTDCNQQPNEAGRLLLLCRQERIDLRNVAHRQTKAVRGTLLIQTWSNQQVILERCFHLWRLTFHVRTVPAARIEMVVDPDQRTIEIDNVVQIPFPSLPNIEIIKAKHRSQAKSSCFALSPNAGRKRAPSDSARARLAGNTTRRKHRRSR